MCEVMEHNKLVLSFRWLSRYAKQKKLKQSNEDKSVEFYAKKLMRKGFEGLANHTEDA